MTREEAIMYWEYFLGEIDQIRAMSDEELAEFLIDLADDGNLRIRDWLKQTAEEEDKHEP